MPKGDVTKVKICISLDKDTHAEIKEHCNKNLIKISTYINHLVKKSHKKNISGKNKGSKK